MYTPIFLPSDLTVLIVQNLKGFEQHNPYSGLESSCMVHGLKGEYLVLQT